MKKKFVHNSQYILLSILLVVYIFPFFLVLINSFKSKRDVIKNPLSIIGTEGFQPGNYILAMKRMNFGSVFMNSLIITVVSVLLITVLSSMTAYFLQGVNGKSINYFFR